jgi:hypothetical protein
VRRAGRRLATPFAIFLAIGVLPAGCGTSCPAALLTGRISRDGDELVVRAPHGGSDPVERIRWPSGYRYQILDGRMIVVDPGGTPRAGEGDEVRLGGGESADHVWGVCGLLEVIPDPS